MNCTHEFKRNSYNYVTTTDRCSICGTTCPRPTTDTEKLEMDARRLDAAKADELRKLFFESCLNKKRPNDEIQELALAFVKLHPQVKISSCDDSYHSSSLFVLIPHVHPKKGLLSSTLVFIANCADEEPTVLHLSESKIDSLINNLALVLKIKHKLSQG